MVIRGGEVVDGTGRTRYRADVGIVDGRIAAIGDLPIDGAGAIDATGRVVTPGFVDVHTHYDAQVFWDPALTPSPLHGVTTALAGNCGFSIAPLPEDAAGVDALVRMLARVEGMPIVSLRDGVPWSWRTMGEYLDAIEGAVGVNIGVLAGHSAIRRVAMGPDASARPATAEERAAMARLLRESLEAGALGFSSSWARTHNDADGNMVPSRWAEAAEIVELCGVLRHHEGTSVQFIPSVGPRFEQWAVELMTAMACAADRPLNWNEMHVTAANLDACRSRLAASDHARARGAHVVALTVPLTVGVRLSFGTGFVLDAIPGWEEAMALPPDAKLALLADPAARDHLRAAAARPDNPVRGVADWANVVIFDVATPDLEPQRGRRVGELAAESGRDPFDVLCELAVADGLATSFGSLPPRETDEDWAARLEVWRDPRAVIGASDAGAHVDLLAAFHYTTDLLGRAVRDQGLLGLEEAVHLLTEVPARLYGLRNRGRIAVGDHADLVVLDPATVGAKEVRMRFDLPGGAGRLHAEADGIDHVLVNGTPIVAHGALTSARPGTVLRAGRDTATPSLR